MVNMCTRRGFISRPWWMWRWMARQWRLAVWLWLCWIWMLSRCWRSGQYRVIMAK